MKKKTMAMLLAIALVLSLTSIYVLAETPEVQIAAGNERGAAVSGTEIAVPVSITQNPGLVVGRVNVAWDHEALELASITYGTGLGQDNDSPAIENDGSYLVSFGDYTPGEDPGANWEETGVLFTLNFEVLEGAEAGTYPIVLTGKSDDFLNNDVQEKDVAFTDGNIELYTLITEVDLAVEAPVKGGVPQATMEAGTGYTAAISWSGEPTEFAANTVYTATVTLTPAADHGFAADAAATVNGAAAEAEVNEEGQLVVTYTFPATAKIDIESAELTITAPATHRVPETTLSGDNFTGAISWSHELDEKGRFLIDTAYTATVVLTPAEDYLFADGFTATVNGEAVEFTANGDGTVTGEITFPVTGEPVNSHLQWIEDESIELYADTNLWKLLEPKKEYHNGTDWRYSHDTVYSVTVPVKPGDKVYANSFELKSSTGGSSHGIPVTFFYGEDMVLNYGTGTAEGSTYAETQKNGGYLIAPEGANAVCIPVWKNNENAAFYMKSLPVRIASADLTVAVPVTGKTPVTEITGENYTGTISWSPAIEDVFVSETVYTATITLTANEGYKFPADAAVTLNGEVVAAERNAEGKMVLTYEFPVTAMNEISQVALNVTAPVKGAAPQDTLEAGENYTGTISWSEDPETFAANTVYTATVVLTPNETYMFAEETSVTVNGAAATSVSLGEDGKLTATYTFPATAKIDIESAELTVTAPESHRVPVTTLSGEGFTGAISWSGELDEKGRFDEYTVYTATVVLTPAEDYLFAEGFTATVNGEAVEFTANEDGTVTGAITFAATVEPVNSRLRWAEDESELYADTNLWTLLGHESGYYASSGWTNKYYSFTIPVEEGDKIYASSFQDKTLNYSPSSRDGVVLAFLYGEDIVDFRGYDVIYAEYVEKGYVEVPAGVNAANVVMWKHNEDSVVNLLTLPQRIASAELTVAAPVAGKAPVTEITETAYTGAISWAPAVEGTFGVDTAYTANIILTANEGYKFPADAVVTVNGNEVTAERNAEGKMVLAYEFPATGKYEIAEVALNITAPVKDQVPQDTMAAGENYTATISWNGAPETFAPNTVYTATVVLTANENYVFAEGITATVNDKAATASIDEDGKLTVTYEFPATEAKDPQTITCENVTATYGDAPKTLEAVASDNGAITYAVAEGEDVISIADGKVTFLKAGTAKITVYAAETEDYAKAEMTIDVTVSAADYTYAMNALTQYVKAGSDLSKITVAAAAGTGVNGEEVSGSVAWYTDEECTVAATADNFATAGEVTLYGAFTATNDNYVKTAKVTAVTFKVLANGDLNGDGKVSTADAMIFFRYLANWNGYAEMVVCMDAADVNNNGIVNIEDATHLARYLADWDGYEI